MLFSCYGFIFAEGKENVEQITLDISLYCEVQYQVMIRRFLFNPRKEQSFSTPYTAVGQI